MLRGKDIENLVECGTLEHYDKRLSFHEIICKFYCATVCILKYIVHLVFD